MAACLGAAFGRGQRKKAPAHGDLLAGSDEPSPRAGSPGSDPMEDVRLALTAVARGSYDFGGGAVTVQFDPRGDVSIKDWKQERDFSRIATFFRQAQAVIFPEGAGLLDKDSLGMCLESVLAAQRAARGCFSTSSGPKKGRNHLGCKPEDQQDKTSCPQCALAYVYVKLQDCEKDLQRRIKAIVAAEAKQASRQAQAEAQAKSKAAAVDAKEAARAEQMAQRQTTQSLVLLGGGAGMLSQNAAAPRQQSRLFALAPGVDPARLSGAALMGLRAATETRTQAADTEKALSEMAPRELSFMHEYQQQRGGGMSAEAAGAAAYAQHQASFAAGAQPRFSATQRATLSDILTMPCASALALLSRMLRDGAIAGAEAAFVVNAMCRHVPAWLEGADMGELQRVSAAAQGLESFPAAVPLYYGLLTALGVAGNALGAAAATLPRQPLSALQQQAWEAQNFGTPWLNPGKTPGQQFTTEGLHAPRRVSNDSTRSEEPPRRIPRRDAASLRAELDATVVAEKDAVAREDFELAESLKKKRMQLERELSATDAAPPPRAASPGPRAVLDYGTDFSLKREAALKASIAAAAVKMQAAVAAEEYAKAAEAQQEKKAFEADLTQLSAARRAELTKPAPELDALRSAAAEAAAAAARESEAVRRAAYVEADAAKAQKSAVLARQAALEELLVLHAAPPPQDPARLREEAAAAGALAEAAAQQRDFKQADQHDEKRKGLEAQALEAEAAAAKASAAAARLAAWREEKAAAPGAAGAAVAAA